jgi:hypothetical protein
MPTDFSLVNKMYWPHYIPPQINYQLSHTTLQKQTPIKIFRNILYMFVN